MLLLLLFASLFFSSFFGRRVFGGGLEDLATYRAIVWRNICECPFALLPFCPFQSHSFDLATSRHVFTSVLKAVVEQVQLSGVCQTNVHLVLDMILRLELILNLMEVSVHTTDTRILSVDVGLKDESKTVGTLHEELGIQNRWP